MRLISSTILISAALSGCSMTKIAADQTADVLELAAPAVNQENDPQLAREAAPGQLKTLEGFWLASPENPIYLRLLAQGYCEYAFGFLEDDIEELAMAGRVQQAEPTSRRATNLYLRCMNYGLKLLGGDWAKAMETDLTSFEKKVRGTGKGKTAGLFWTALGLASAINLNRDDINIVSYLPKAKMMLEQVVRLDERFYNGGAHLALGMVYTAQGTAVGGNPELGKKHFERAIELTGGKYLMPKVLYAMSYGVVQNQREFFRKTLVEVLNTSPAIWPEQRLANELAHIRARRYLAHEKELF